MSLLILSLLISAIFFTLGIFLRKDGKKSTNPLNYSHGMIGIYLGCFILILGIAYTFLFKEAWTDDNKQLFFYVLLSSSFLFSLLFSLGILIKSFKSKNKIGLINASFWSLSCVFIGAFGFLRISNMNNGWTNEKEYGIINRCKSEGKYDCDCMFEFIKSTFSNPQDYNALMEDETKNNSKINALRTKFDGKCLKCDSLKMVNQTLSIDEGLPD